METITYKIEESRFSREGDNSIFDLTIVKDKYVDADDESWFMRFNTLAETYAQISAFASKYHLDMEVITVQTEPIYYYRKPTFDQHGKVVAYREEL
tara:strand:- start:950 stop:1237 length:288 start_codon:yes stop_codon:yes gene_type:complete